MGRFFRIWVFQAVWVSIFALCVFGGLNYFQLPVGTGALWVSGILFYWVLSGIVILPWNIYFAAEDALEEIRETEEKGGKINERDREYARKAKHKSGMWAVVLHVSTALVFFSLALFTQLGNICYLAALAALLLTGFRPAIRTMEHVRDRLATIQNRVKFPRDDVYELKQRVQKLEYYDDIAKELQKTFEKKCKELDEQFTERCSNIHEAVDKNTARIHELENLILHIQKNIGDKVDTFDDAVAFKAAWERVAPELAKIFRGKS